MGKSSVGKAPTTKANDLNSAPGTTSVVRLCCNKACLNMRVWSQPR